MSSRRRIRLAILPLPNAVLFPRTLLPLDISDQRGRQLVADALDDDSTMGVLLLQPGWERNYHQSVDVYGTGGIGLITEHRTVEEGNYQILLHGKGRFAIRDFQQITPYHVAEVEMLEDRLPEERQVRKMRRDLIRYFLEIAENVSPDAVDRAVLSELDFHTLVNSVCASLNFSIYEKQRLLELEDLGERGDAVLRVLRDQVHQLRLISRFRHLEPDDARVN